MILYLLRDQLFPFFLKKTIILTTVDHDCLYYPLICEYRWDSEGFFYAGHHELELAATGHTLKSLRETLLQHLDIRILMLLEESPKTITKKDSQSLKKLCKYLQPNLKDIFLRKFRGD